MITALTVNYNTPDLIDRSYRSIRRHHRDMSVIIIDGSDDRTSEMYNDHNTKVVFAGHNIGHGRGLHMGLTLCWTPLALIFDSDIEMLKSPVEDMIDCMEHDTYGVGWVYYIGEDGVDYGTPGKKHKKKIPYLHPYFALINVRQYFMYKPFVHHGAPCYQAMIDIYKKNASHKLINHPLITGHTSGEGINWKGRHNEYIRHDFGGTRMANRQKGLPEINKNWE